jgi:hypothetical protein
MIEENQEPTPKYEEPSLIPKYQRQLIYLDVALIWKVLFSLSASANPMMSLI